MTAERKFTARELYALIFGLFLGLCIWKFGNPVIIDRKVSAPVSISEFFGYSWPPHWVNWILFPLVVFGAFVVMAANARWTVPKLFWLLPLLWLGWQFVAATQTVDSNLTVATLWQFSGCTACYFLGAFLFDSRRALNFLLVGILAAFAFCLIRAIDQHVVEFPQSRQMLIEGQSNGWTNFPPTLFAEMKRDGVVVNTNGVYTVSPKILDKFSGGRVMGTMVYPNALAGLVLLLFPISFALVFIGTKKLRPVVRVSAIALTLFLGFAALFWSGSKLGWLIAIAVVGVYLLRFNWPAKLKLTTIAVVGVIGLGIFAIRFHHYFSTGATSVSARFDYWRAAVQTTTMHPLFGTGPGTFQRPYAQLKSPTAEMARLTHNDFLEQFSDSGIPGGIFYATWIIAGLIFSGRKLWKTNEYPAFAIFLGLLAWFAQGLGEFELYVPALAWTAFTLLGCLIAMTANPFDKKLSGAKISKK